MIVAQRKYNDQVEKYTDVKENPQIKQHQAKNFKAIHKFQIIFSIMIIGSLCIGILFGYVRLSELRYKVNLLDKEIVQLQATIQNLEVEVEKVKRSDIVEEKAKGELGMQYPTKDQMVFLNMDQTSMAGISDTAEKDQVVEEISKNKLMDNVKGRLYKVLALLD